MTSGIRKYAAKQGLITGVCTVVICLILFFFMIKGSMPLSAIYADLPLTVGPTGFLCALIQIFTTRGPVKKGVVPPAGSLDEQAAYLLVPKNSVAFLIYFGAELPRFGYIVMKALLAGAAGGLGTYHAIIFICGIYQEKLAAEQTE